MSVGGTSNPRAGHQAVSFTSSAHFHLQLQQKGCRLPGLPCTTAFTSLAGGCMQARQQVQFLLCSQHKPGQPPPPCSLPCLPCGGRWGGWGVSPAPEQVTTPAQPWQPPDPETCGPSVPFILSKNNGCALGDLVLWGVGSWPSHGCILERAKQMASSNTWSVIAETLQLH